MSERQRSHLLLPAAAAIAAPLLYVLSVGPVVWLMSHGWLSPQNETVEAVSYTHLTLPTILLV